jgi:hypothetical protein
MEAFRKAEAKKIGALEEFYLLKEFNFKMSHFQQRVQNLLET